MDVLKIVIRPDSETYTQGLNKETANPDCIKIKVSKEVVNKPFIDKQAKFKNSPELQGFVELNPGYLYHLHGSWIKYSCDKNSKFFTGGFLDKILENSVYLRCPSKDNIIVNLNLHTFYVKENNENYLALVRLIYSKHQEINSLVNFKTKILKMLNDGKVKFIKSSKD